MGVHSQCFAWKFITITKKTPGILYNSPYHCIYLFFSLFWNCHINVLVQERKISNALSMEFSLPCTNPLIFCKAYSMLSHQLSYCKKFFLPLLHRRWEWCIVDSPRCLSIRPSVCRQCFRNFLKKLLAQFISYTDGTYPYGVGLLTPMHFRVPNLIFGPLVAEYLAYKWGFQNF